MPASGARSVVMAPERVQRDSGMRPVAAKDSADVGAGDEERAVLVERDVRQVARVVRPERLDELTVECPRLHLSDLAGPAVDADDQVPVDVEGEAVAKATRQPAHDVAPAEAGCGDG